MTNEALKSSDLIKIIFLIIIHILMILVSVLNPFFIIVTIIPVIILLIGYYLMRRENDALIFSKTLIICKRYAWVIAIGLCLVMVFHLYESDATFSEWMEYMAYTLLIPLAAFIYCSLINLLLRNPFEKHQNWIANKGIFSYSSNQQ